MLMVFKFFLLSACITIAFASDKPIDIVNEILKRNPFPSSSGDIDVEKPKELKIFNHLKKEQIVGVVVKKEGRYLIVKKGNEYFLIREGDKFSNMVVKHIDLEKVVLTKDGKNEIVIILKENKKIK